MCDKMKSEEEIRDEADDPTEEAEILGDELFKHYLGEEECDEDEDEDEGHWF